MRGLFLSFEGMDGCGKTTQMRFLAEYLREKGIDPLLTREPGGTPISEKIRGLLLDRDNREMTDAAEVLLYAAARAQHVREVIRPALEAGRVVLSDRFIDSSLAYQGFGRGLGVDEVLAVNEYSVQGTMPDRTFFLDATPAESFSRMDDRTERDRLEDQDAGFYQRLYAGYGELAKMFPERVVRIDASGDKFQTREIIRAHADRMLAERA